MRVYFTTTVPAADSILRDGFTDTHEEFGMRGVYASTAPLGANDGFGGDVTLCLEVPVDSFRVYDVSDGVMRESGYRLALIPAVALNSLGPPLVYDHAYAGMPRGDL